MHNRGVHFNRVGNIISLELLPSCARMASTPIQEEEEEENDDDDGK